MISFQVEPLRDCWDQAQALRELHFEEVGQGKLFGWELDPDLARFQRIENEGLLHITTARANGELVGYHVATIERLLHYKTILAAKGSSYFLHKDFRTGRTPVRLFEKVERTLLARGVKVLYDGFKLSHGHGKLFKFLGYTPLEALYVKKIGD